MFIYTTKAGMLGGRRPVHLSFSSRTCSPDGGCSSDHSANLAHGHSPTRQPCFPYKEKLSTPGARASICEQGCADITVSSLREVRSKQSQMNSSGQNTDCETIKLDEYVVGG